MHRLSQQCVVAAVKGVMTARLCHSQRKQNNTALVVARRTVFVFENCAVRTRVIPGFEKDISEVFW